MQEQEDDFDFISSFKKSSNKLSAVRDDFKAFLDANLISLNSLVEKLVKNNPTYLIVTEMKQINLRTTNHTYTARLQFLLNHLAEEGIKEYKEHLKSEYSKDSIEKETEELKERAKSLKESTISEKDKKVLRDEIDKYNEFLHRLEQLQADVDNLIEEDLYGDLSLDDTNLPAVQFSFKGLEDAYIKAFVKDVKKIKSDANQKIRKITISKDPNSNHAIVLFFFDNDDDKMEFYSTKALLEGVYDKYIRLGQGAKGEYNWDIVEHKFAQFINANLPATDPLSGMFQDPNKPFPVSPEVESLSDDITEDEEIVYDENSFLNSKASDFVFFVENEYFYITTKEYWIKYAGIYYDHINIEHLLPEGFGQDAESTFSYDGLVEDGIQLLIDDGFTMVNHQDEQDDDQDDDSEQEDEVAYVKANNINFGLKIVDDKAVFAFVPKDLLEKSYLEDIIITEIDENVDWSVPDPIYPSIFEYKDGSLVHLKDALYNLALLGMSYDSNIWNLVDDEATIIPEDIRMLLSSLFTE